MTVQVPPTIKPVVLVADHVFSCLPCARGAAVCPFAASPHDSTTTQISATTAGVFLVQFAVIATASR